jgi:DNA-binding GntR family transcriptional regulator
MAQALGWSKSRLHEVLHQLAHQGVVDLITNKTGTVVRLAA